LEGTRVEGGEPFLPRNGLVNRVPEGSFVNMRLIDAHGRGNATASSTDTLAGG
jgi:hypothetical protein